MALIHPSLISSTLDLEQVRDIRRTVLCGELNWDRQVVDDGEDADADVALLVDAHKPVATARLILRGTQGWVDLLAVLPSRRRRGLGTALIVFLAALAETKGARHLCILATPQSAPFFQAAGFSSMGGEGAVLLFSRDFV